MQDRDVMSQRLRVRSAAARLAPVLPPILHRRLARLALLAALMMAFVPSFARLVASASPQVLSGLTELCTVSGLKLVDLSALQDAKGETSTGDHGTAECPFCLLAAAFAVALLAITVCLLQGRRDARPPHSHAWPHIVGPPLRGLGSRGPPSTCWKTIAV